MNKRFGAFSSSANPAELAATVKAAILALGIVIIWLGKNLLGIELQPADVSDLAINISGMVAAIWGAYGVVRKGVVWAIDKYNTLRS